MFTTLSCAHCSPGEAEPNIRVQKGIEYCKPMCQKFTDLKCVGYYEDIVIDCSKDPVYKNTMDCPDGSATISCTQFCEYEMKNSVQLNPKCISETLTTCSEIENICK